MKLYTISDLHQGVGVFDHVMRCASEHTSDHKTMPTPVAIGVLSAAMQSGLTDSEISEMIERYFDTPTAELLRTLWRMYDGDDLRIHLWNRKGLRSRILGQYLFCVRPNWRKRKPYEAFEPSFPAY